MKQDQTRLQFLSARYIGQTRSWRRKLLLGGTLALSGALPAAASNSAPGEVPAELRPAIVTAMEQARVPGLAIAGINNGQLAWMGAFGESAPGVPMSADTVFNVASLTKPVFALMNLHLVAQGRLALDEPLAEHWIDPDIADDPRRNLLTPRIVLSHQTGFPNWRGNGKLGFAFTPGARHEYSGEGFEYLRRALERRTGQSMEQLMEGTLLTRVDMPQTRFGWHPELEGKVATGFRPSGDPHDMDQLRQRRANAAANMMTTIGDYARFAAWVAGGADLPEALFHQMQQPQALHDEPAEAFGLGWRIIDVDGQTVLFHDGREPGVRTQVFVIPETGGGLVVLSNSDNGELLTRPLVQAALPQGEALVAQIARDTWTFLQRMPTEQLPQMSRVIAGNPAFMAKLLHAVDVALIQQSGLPAAQRKEVPQAIEAFVHDMLSGRTVPEQAQQLVAMAIDGDGEPGGWHAAFTTEQAQQWLDALQQRQQGRATREPVPVTESVLASYAGDYRVPSSQLLIRIDHGQSGLQATAEGMPVIRLLPQSQTEFFMREDDTRFDFVVEDQKVTGVRLIWSNGRSELAVRED